MALQPSVSIAQSPGAWNLAYGINQFTLVDANTTNPKYVLQIWDADGLTKRAEVRQQANLYGVAHFDVAKVLQGQLNVNPQLPSRAVSWVTSELEVYDYLVKVGYVNSQGNTVIQNQQSGYRVVNGRKRFDKETWDTTPYISEYTVAGSGLHVRTSQAEWLSDWTKVKNLSSYSDGVPSGLTSDTQVYEYDVASTDWFSLSAINQANVSDGSTLPIGRLRIVSYNGSTQLDDITVDNLLGQGGGPNYIQCIDFDNESPYWILSTSCGPAQLALTSGWTHYYVWFVPVNTTVLGCTSLNPMTYAYRFNMADAECNDYSHVQLSWLNSFGFRDYFSFDKRHDENVTIKRNEYYQMPGTWNSAGFAVNHYDRGRRVFSSEVEVTWTLTSRYLTEDEYAYLKNLVLSPDVQVRYDGDSTWSSTEWVAATVTTSRWTNLTYRKQKLFQMEIDIKLANNIQIQRG